MESDKTVHPDMMEKIIHDIDIQLAFIESLHKSISVIKYILENGSDAFLKLSDEPQANQEAEVEQSETAV